MGDIVWFASYPKSGNTWLRIFLANYTRGADNPISINQIGFKNAATGYLFEQGTGLILTDLSSTEIRQLRPQVYRHLAEEVEGTLYFKIHDAFCLPGKPNERIVPADVTKGIIYLVRNPLDITISYAYHEGISIDETISRMATTSYAIGAGYPRIQVPQQLCSWSEHVISWLDDSNLPICVLRYEDMLLRAFDTFSEVIQFVGFESNQKKIREAIQASSFSEIKKQEQLHGFREQSIMGGDFFRKGQAGDWKKNLSADQVHRVLQTHGKVMQRLGYLDTAGNPL